MDPFGTHYRSRMVEPEGKIRLNSIRCEADRMDNVFRVVLPSANPPVPVQHRVAIGPDEVHADPPARVMREDHLRKPERVAAPAARESKVGYRFGDQQLQDIVALSQDAHWTKRVEALQLMKIVFDRLQEAGGTTGSSEQGLQKLMDILVAQMSESNNSIIQASFVALESALRGFSPQLEAKIPQVLAKVLLRVTDPKPRIRYVELFLYNEHTHLRILCDYMQRVCKCALEPNSRYLRA